MFSECCLHVHRGSAAVSSRAVVAYRMPAQGSVICFLLLASMFAGQRQTLGGVMPSPCGIKSWCRQGMCAFKTRVQHHTWSPFHALRTTRRKRSADTEGCIRRLWICCFTSYITILPPFVWYIMCSNECRTMNRHNKYLLRTRVEDRHTMDVMQSARIKGHDPPPPPTTPLNLQKKTRGRYPARMAPPHKPS